MKRNSMFDQFITSIDSGLHLQFLFSGQCHCYKAFLSADELDITLPVAWRNINPELPNEYYNQLVEKFNMLSADSIIEMRKNNWAIVKIAHRIASIQLTNGQRIKKVKKRLSIILSELKKAYKNGLYNTDSRRLLAAIVLFHFAFRESFLNIRFRLQPNLYKAIPQAYCLVAMNGSAYTVNDLFSWDKKSRAYTLNKKIEKQSLRQMQLSLAPFIFSQLKPSRKYGNYNVKLVQTDNGIKVIRS